MIGFVVRRLRGRLPLAAAVLLTVLIATTALSALLAFSRGVDEAGLRQAIHGPGRARTTVTLTAEHPTSGRAEDDEAVRAFATGLFGRLPVDVRSVARSRSYGLPGPRAPGREADLTLLAALDRDRVRLLSGEWPRPLANASARVQVAVPQAALNRLGLSADELPAEVGLDDRYGGPPLTVRVTGVYRAAEPTAPYWRLDPLGGRELQVGAFTTYGPLLSDDSAFTAGGLPQDSRAALLTADFTAADASDIEAVRAAATRLDTHGPLTIPLAATGLKVRTELPALLSELTSAQRVARSTLLVGALQLAVLAAAALLLVAHLMTDRKEAERVLLTARGASRRRLGLLTCTESLLLALPAAVLAPLVTPPLLRLAGRLGPLSGLSLDSAGTWSLWPVAVGCALVCVLLTTLPAVSRGAASAVLRRTGSRQAVVAGAARAGGDLALVVLAVLAYARLARYSGDEGLAARDGGLGVDPVLVAAPTLALCAGTVLVLRLLPFAARLGGRVAARGRGLGAVIVGRQLARRPKRATGPVLLLVLAVSSGVLALGQHTAWTDSQRDQADFVTAGGLRVSGSDLSAMGRAGRYSTLPGGDRMIPVIRGEHSLPGGRAAAVVALDATAVAERVPLREDLRDGRPMRELFGPLSSAAPAANGIALPGRPRRIDIDVSLDSAGTPGAPGLGVLLRDRFGLTYRAPMRQLPASGATTVSVDVDALADAPIGSAAGPLSIVGFVVTFSPDPRPYGSDGPREQVGGEVTVRGVAVSNTPDGPAVRVPAAAPAWHLTAPTTKNDARVGVLREAGGALVRMRYLDPRDTTGPVQVSVTAGGPPAAEVPGVATRAYLRAIGADVGDLFPVPLGGDSLPVRITAAVETLPVVGDTAVAVDLATLGRLFAAQGGKQVPPTDEWWLPAASADDPAPARAAAALRAGAGVQEVRLRGEVVAGLLDDPLSAGPQAALAALALACAILAAIGFAASAAANARERSGEFAVLLALGAPRRALARTAATESGLLVGLGTGVGLVLGAAIVHLTVPLVVLTPGARRPVPEVLVDLPVTTTLLLVAGIAAVPLLSTVFGGHRNRDALSAAARLRHVEDM
ncbi:FtsX-like permease family protein [Streptomyces sp. NPDC051000]|uniref:FtsX-like permease family protein n=1 Tax=Streptomyces sp. NPDC051000 TaxID=3155520 RepID=UPI0033F116F7